MAVTAQKAAPTATATAGVAGKMVAATAERTAMTVAGRKGMTLTEAKVAATAAIDCRCGRDSNNSRKCGDSGSACTDGSNGRDSTDRSRDGSSSGGSNGSSNGGSNGGDNDASNRQDGRDDGSDCNNSGDGGNRSNGSNCNGGREATVVYCNSEGMAAMTAMVMPAATVVMAGKAVTEAVRAGMAVDCYK